MIRVLNINKFSKDLEELKIVKKELISKYEEGYIGKKIYLVTCQDGSTKKVEQITKNRMNGDAVIIIPVTNDSKFVMILESRPNTIAEMAVEFPAGMVEDGENPIETAKRELREETGYVCENIYEIENHHQDQGCSKAVVRVYVATGCKKVEELKGDGTEKIFSLKLEKAEILKMIKESDVKMLGINDSGSKLAFLTYLWKEKDDDNE